MIRFAARLLDADGEIRVLHVIGSTSLPSMTREWRSSVDLVVPAHETGAALDVRVDPEVRAAADVPGEILESAESHDVDAILMPLRGDRRGTNPFFGHTASAVLHHAHCDVLIMNRLALAEERVPRILIPTPAAAAPPKAMRLAEELAVRNKGIPIITLSLAGGGRGPDPPPDRSPRGVPVLHRRPLLSPALLGRRHRLAELIMKEAARERYGLLIVGDDTTQPAPMITRRFLEELFRAAPCPVIAVRG